MGFSFGPGGLGMLVVIIVLTTVGGRLLGIRLRWWRALVAGFPGLVIGIIIVWAAEGHPRAPRTLPTGAVLFTALIATMLIAVLRRARPRPTGLHAPPGDDRRHLPRRPHPGNVLLLTDGRLALIDFGSVGRLDTLQQAALRRLLLAVANRNPSELHDALIDLAEVRYGSGPGDEVLERALAQFMARHLGPGIVPDAAMFTALFTLLTQFGITFPPVIGGAFRRWSLWRVPWRCRHPASRCWRRRAG